MTPVGGFRIIENYSPEPRAPTEEEITLVEYIEPLQEFKLIERYFADPGLVADSIDLEVEGHQIAIFGINEDEQREEFEKALGDLLEPVVQTEDFPQFISLERLKTLLGERACEQTVKKLHIHWRLPKENLPKLHDRVDKYIEAFCRLPTEHEWTEEELKEIRQIQSDETDRIIKMFTRYREVKDHYVEEEAFSDLIEVAKMTLHPWPRVERLKQALRDYFDVTQNREISAEDLALLDLEAPFHWEKIELNARRSLEMACMDTGLKIVFRIQGKEVALGAAISKRSIPPAEEDDPIHPMTSDPFEVIP